MLTVFVSDLHLSAERPAQVELFFKLLESLGANSTLYILGDLFELLDESTAVEYRPAARLLGQVIQALLLL